MKKSVLVSIICMSFLLNVNAQKRGDSSVPVDVISVDDLAGETDVDISKLLACGPSTGKINIRGYVAAGVSGLTKSGFGFSDSNNGYDSSPIFSGIVGAEIKLPFFGYDKFGFRTGLAFQTNGAKFSMGGDSYDFNYKIKLIYLKAPVLVDYEVSNKIIIYSGFKAGILLSAKQEDDNDSYDIKDQVNSFDFGGVLGGEYNIYCNDKISLGAGLNYDFGFSDINDYDGADKLKNSGITAFFSTRF